jgi:hypothetical protein
VSGAGPRRRWFVESWQQKKGVKEEGGKQNRWCDVRFYEGAQQKHCKPFRILSWRCAAFD